MGEKLKSKSKNRLSSLFSKSSVPSTTTTAGDLPRRNSMPPARGAQYSTSPTGSSSYFWPKARPTISSSAVIRPRTAPSPTNISTPPPVRLRVPRRSSSPSGVPTQRRRHTGLSTREQRRANERRAATLESEKCRAELSRAGVVVRDFQAEHDLEEHRRMLVLKMRGSSQDQDLCAGASSEDEKVLLRGRKHDRQWRSGDSRTAAVPAVAAS